MALFTYLKRGKWGGGGHIGWGVTCLCPRGWVWAYGRRGREGKTRKTKRLFPRALAALVIELLRSFKGELILLFPVAFSFVSRVPLTSCTRFWVILVPWCPRS